MSKPRFASQVDVNNNLSIPVTQYYLLKEKESAFAKPNHMIASSSSRNSSKNMPKFSSNDMVHNHYLDKARKKTQKRDRNSKTSVMPSAGFQSTTDDSKPKPMSNNQTPRSLPISKGSCVTITAVPKADHSKSSSSVLDSKHFVCSTCHKCVFNANHDACITKLPKEVNSRHRFSPNKTSDVYEKTSPRSDLRWKPTGRILKTIGLRWIPTRKILASYISKDDCESTHGSNVNIHNIHKCKQTLDLSEGTSINVQKEHGFDLSADMIVMTSMIELESLFGPLFDKYFNGENQVVSKSSAVTTADASDKRQQQRDSTSSTSTLATNLLDPSNIEFCMSTRSSTRNLFPPLEDPERTIRRRTRVDLNLLNNFEEINIAANRAGNDGPPPAGGDGLPVPDLQTMEELCQPTLNGRAYQAPAYQAPALAYQAPPYQAPVYQAPIPQPQVVMNAEFSSYMKANDAILKNMQTNMTTLANSTNDLKNMLGQFMKMNTASTSGSGTLSSNTITNLREDLKGITTRSGVAYKGPTIPTTSSFPPKVVERETEVTKDTVPSTNNGGTEDVQPLVVQVETQVPISEPDVEPVEAPVSALKPNPKPSIPYPSRLNDQKLLEKANNQMEKFFQIFQDLHFDISFADALILMPKFASTIKSLLSNKEKLFELARTPLNEHCSAVLLKKLPKKLRNPDKFLIPCDFPGMDECLALADLGASINLMPLSVWRKLSLLELTPTCMTLELADRSISRLIGVAEDVSVKVGKFHFPAEFVVVDFDVDPRVPLILERSFLKTGHALIDVYKGELTLRVGNKAVTFNLDQTSRYSSNYDDISVNRIDVIDVACEECSQEVLGFSVSSNSTPSTEPIVSTSSPTLTPFGDRDILLLEEFLNDDPSSPPLPPQELKVVEPKNEKSSIDEPPEVELKDLPSHLEYALLEGTDKLPVIIAKDLKDEEKAALIKVLKSHKRALAWQLSDIKGINPEFYTHKILMEDDFKPAVQHQRRVNPKIHEVIKKEVLKLLDAGLIYPISDSPWVSPVHCVPKKGGFTIVENEENELIPTRLRLAGNEYYYFLDGFSGYFQIPIDPQDQEKTTFTCPYGTFAYRRMPFGLCNAPGTFQRCMVAIFHDMIEKTMEVFMDDFSVFGNSFENCLSHLDKILKRCEDTNLFLNWEKSHFMVKEGIVLGHKISKNGIEVDKAKVDVITKLPHPTTVKGI
ncbi:reverse transcriptase domain-containing protein [Tanacetum coccineum]